MSALFPAAVFKASHVPSSMAALTDAHRAVTVPVKSAVVAQVEGTEEVKETAPVTLAGTVVVVVVVLPAVVVVVVVVVEVVVVVHGFPFWSILTTGMLYPAEVSLPSHVPVPSAPTNPKINALFNRVPDCP